MYKITFPAAALKNTDALYLPHHSEVPIIECEQGMLIQYTEFRRHYVLHVPCVRAPFIAGDSTEIVEILVTNPSVKRNYLIAFLTENHIAYGEMYALDIAEDKPKHVRDRRYYYPAAAQRQAPSGAGHRA